MIPSGTSATGGMAGHYLHHAAKFYGRLFTCMPSSGRCCREKGIFQVGRVRVGMFLSMAGGGEIAGSVWLARLARDAWNQLAPLYPIRRPLMAFTHSAALSMYTSRRP